MVVSQRLVGPLVTVGIVAGVGAILLMNLQLGPPTVRTPAALAPPPGSTPPAPLPAPAMGVREYPIGDSQERAGMSIAAVWLPSVQMDGMAAPMSADVIHLEADVRALAGNRQGFPKDQFVPYLSVAYTVAPAGGGPPLHQGEMIPMVARDGLHYGTSLDLPGAGRYRLTYALKPLLVGGLGLHRDPATGVDPWWEPFEVTFDWDYPGPPK